ncbi:MAG: hypothetical protein HeimC3_52790 [Candidatus Heimdallarchaeota archaeon LC_3]|nr:MAG: hypothetical protein HeimC3_52790 [Candidatus Heimdallarchaeota archaeon LC_3]
MSQIKFSTGFGSHRNFSQALSDMKNEVNSIISNPDGLLLVIGPYSLTKQEFQTELDSLREHFNNCPMIGTQQQAVFTFNGDKPKYALKGVACLAWKGIKFIPKRIKNIRLNPKKKGKKFRKVAKNRKKSEYHLFFPPGIYYPPPILNPLRGKPVLNPLSIYNTRAVRHTKIFYPIFKLVNKMQNIFNMGIPYTSIWDFIEKFRNNETYHNFSGAFGINTDTFNRTYQFHNWKVTANDLIIGSFSNSKLKFGTGFGVGIDSQSAKKLEISNNLSGGIITAFNNSQKISKHILANETLFNQLSIDSDIWNRNTEANLGLSVFHPYFIQPESLTKKNNSKNVLDNFPSLYFLMANNNMKSTMIAAPDQVVDQIRQKKVSAYLGIQSARDIIASVKNAVNGALINGNINNLHAGIFIECSNRAQALEEQFIRLLDENIHYVNKPFLGLVTSGEIAPRTFPIVCSSLVTVLIGE